jgi:hypothetical protein
MSDLIWKEENGVHKAEGFGIDYEIHLMPGQVVDDYAYLVKCSIWNTSDACDGLDEAKVICQSHANAIAQAVEKAAQEQLSAKDSEIEKLKAEHLDELREMARDCAEDVNAKDAQIKAQGEVVEKMTDVLKSIRYCFLGNHKLAEIDDALKPTPKQEKA